MGRMSDETSSVSSDPERRRPPTIIWVTVAVLAAFALLGGVSAVALGIAYARGTVNGPAVPASLAVTGALAVVYLVVAVLQACVLALLLRREVATWCLPR
jgi:hypothetical protein